MRNSWGTFWGEMGFFKVPRGNNFMMLEACDCWYGNPTWHMEGLILDGSIGGSMAGTVKLDKHEAVGAGSHLQTVRALLRASSSA